ncbi:MAG: beta-propeller fold lactonase family protein [Bacteroidota bacterium]
MKLKLFYPLTMSWLFTLLTIPLFGQLHYEGMVFDGLGKPLLETPSSVVVSPSGKHVYVTSFSANAINVYSREDDGQLTYQSSLKGGIDGVAGIGGAMALTMSPEGNHLYVAGSTDNSLAVFSRDVITGALTFVSNYTTGVDGVDGISGANAIDFSPDGNFVYVTGADDNAVVVFSRNVLTGTLTFVQILQDENGDVNDLNYPVGVQVSKDANNVYVTSYGDNSVTVFQRDAVTGMLTFQQVIRNGVDGVAGMLGSYAICFSASGEQAYVAGIESHTIVLFDRDEMGNLTYSSHYENGVDGVSGIFGVNAITMSPNGKHLLATGGSSGSLAVFARNGADGSLVQINNLENGVDGVMGMDFPNSVVISEDGRNAFVTNFGGNTFVVFAFNDMDNVEFVTSEGPEGEGVDGLSGADDLALSPDGRHIYAAGSGDGAIAIFERDELSGEMTFVDTVTANLSGGIESVMVSPDGAYVYSVSFWDDQINVFERDAMTGELTKVQVLTDTEDGVVGLDGVNNLTTSSDGSFVYATGFWEGTLVVFSRDENTGMLSYVESFADNENGVDGLNRPAGVTISPDGQSLYLSGASDDAIAWFSRNPDQGTLTFEGVYRNTDPNISYLDAPSGLVVSPDGSKVYVATNRSNALVTFDRDETGALSYREAMVDAVDEVTGLEGANEVAISSDGLYIYVLGSGQSTISSFRLNVTTGSLAFERTRYDDRESVNGLLNGSGIALSPNDRYIYVTASGDNSLARFSCTYFVDLSEMICEGDSVVVGGSTYKISGLYQDTFTIGSCLNIVNLDLAVQAKEIAIEAAICEGDEYEFAGQSYDMPGEYTQAYTSTMGCDSIVSLFLEVVETFETEMIEVQICGGEKYILGATAYDETGVYTQVTLSPFGCEQEVVLDLTVLPAYDEQISEIICAGDRFVFGTSNYTTTGTYTEVMQTVEGCDSIVTLNLTVLPEDGSSQTIEQTICAGEVFRLGDEEYSATGVYTQTLDNGECSAELVLDLTVLDAPESTMESAVICEGEAFMWNGLEYFATGVYEDRLPAVNGCDSLVVLELVVEPSKSHEIVTLCAGETIEFGGDVLNTSGNYSFVEMTANDCETTFSLNLTVLEELEGSSMIVDDTGTDNGSISVMVEGGMAPYSYEWSNGATTTDLSNVPAGDYTVTITDANGCTVSYTYTVDLVSSLRDLSDGYAIELRPNLLAPGATAQLLIDSDRASELAIRLLDYRGQELNAFRAVLTSGQNRLEVAAPAVAGLYLVQVSATDGRSQTFRLSVQ